MRYLLIGFIFVLLLGSTALAKDERPRCELCNMFWDISTTRITAEFKGTGSHKFESLGCLFQSVSGKSQVTQLKVLDYATATSKSPKMIEGKKAQYLYGTGRLKGSMAPFIAAFSSKAAATAAQEDLGGECMTYDQVWKKLEATLGKND